MLCIILQLLLLQESWKDLFILHLAQWAIPWDLSNLLMARQIHLRKAGNILPNEEEVIDMEMKSMQVKAKWNPCVLRRNALHARNIILCVHLLIVDFQFLYYL